MSLEEAIAIFGAVAPDQRFGRWTDEASQAFRVIARVMTLPELREVYSALETARASGDRRPFDEVWRRVSAALVSPTAADIVPIRRK